LALAEGQAPGSCAPAPAKPSRFTPRARRSPIDDRFCYARGVAVPAEIPGIGSTAQKLRVSPAFDPMRAGIGPEEYFVMSRIDGATTLRDVIVMTGMPLTQAISIVTRLRERGALLLPGESAPAALTPPPAPRSARAQPSTPPPAAVPSPAAATGSAPTRAPLTQPPEAAPVAAARAPSAPSPPAPAAPPPPKVMPLDLELPSPSDAERTILSADLEASDAERRTILAMARRMGSDPWTILGVPKGTELGELKKAYFRLSKEVHPDRFYGKRLGPLAEVLSTVFESVSRAYTVLTEAKKQRDRAPRASSPQAPSDHAVELFERGCAAEVSGDFPNALQLFAASLRVDPQLRVYRRAASCALAASQPKLGLEYAKKAQLLAPEDPSCARLLARAFRATGELQSAEEVLVFALALPIDNDSLMAELRADLALVRKQLTQA
jgi:DnaJ domain